MAFKFYSALPNNFEVLSFDLDDTLYQNEDVIIRAEQAQFDAVCHLVPEARDVGITKWQKLKWQVAKSMPDVRHDVSEWRFQVIKQGLADFGITDEQAVQQIYQVFYVARSNFTVPAETFSVLTQLKTKFKLIAVTNGNVDINRVGLGPYFDAYYRAGEHNCRMKPYPDMLLKAVNDLSLSCPSKILHIGDNIKADVKSAQYAGVASIWFNPHKDSYPSGYSLPTAEYSDLSDLLQLMS